MQPADTCYNMLLHQEKQQGPRPDNIANQPRGPSQPAVGQRHGTDVG